MAARVEGVIGERGFPRLGSGVAHRLSFRGRVKSIWAMEMTNAMMRTMMEAAETKPMVGPDAVAKP